MENNSDGDGKFRPNKWALGLLASVITVFISVSVTLIGKAIFTAWENMSQDFDEFNLTQERVLEKNSNQDARIEENSLKYEEFYAKYYLDITQLRREVDERSSDRWNRSIDQAGYQREQDLKHEHLKDLIDRNAQDIDYIKQMQHRKVMNERH